MTVLARLHHHKDREVGEVAAVLGEIRIRMVVVEFFENDVAYRHSECCVCGLFRMNPPVGVFGDFAVVRADVNDLSAVIAGFGQEVRIRRTGH